MEFVRLLGKSGQMKEKKMAPEQIAKMEQEELEAAIKESMQLEVISMHYIAGVGKEKRT